MTTTNRNILITGATPHENWLNSDIPEDLDTINRGSNGAYNSTLDYSSQGIKDVHLLSALQFL